MRLRKLEAGDKAAYFALASAFYQSGATLYSVPVKNIENTFEELMRRDTYAECWLCEEAGEAIGFLLVAKTFSQESGGMVTWIEELYLKEAYRGAGRGKQMIAFIEKQFPASRFRLEAEPDNEKAIRLYRNLGYQELNYLQYVKEEQ
ncbi:MAG: GNAT family N-acetyltransferase [Ruminococcaceae bacterium]|nr:GNAT family N-acetyltransferase [Oscillospiraceae bacterium]